MSQDLSAFWWFIMLFYGAIVMWIAQH